MFQLHLEGHLWLLFISASYKRELRMSFSRQFSFHNCFLEVQEKHNSKMGSISGKQEQRNIQMWFVGNKWEYFEHCIKSGWTTTEQKHNRSRTICVHKRQFSPQIQAISRKQHLWFMVVKWTFSSQVTTPDIPAASMPSPVPWYATSVALCHIKIHFRVAFYCNPRQNCAIIILMNLHLIYLSCAQSLREVCV